MSYPITTITVRRYLDEDGDDCVQLDVEPPEATLVEVLGLLRFAEDTAIREAMDNDDEDEL